MSTQEPEPEPCEDELEQIRRYVAELKNPDLNRSYTTETLMAEYKAFAERFMRSLGVFAGELQCHFRSELRSWERNFGFTNATPAFLRLRTEVRSCERNRTKPCKF